MKTKEQLEIELLTKQLENEKNKKHSNAAVAAIISFFLPGLGQVYQGRPMSGFLWFSGVAIGYCLFIVPGVFAHFLCVLSAACGGGK